MGTVILAQTAQSNNGPELVPVESIWQAITSLDMLQALMFIAFGVVWLFYGWRVFKVLVVISFALLGLSLGVMLAERISGQSAQVLGGLVGMVLFGMLSVPLMRWAVSILGAVAGGLLTAGVWYAFGLPEQYIWAGALIGVIAGGMISFIIFKIAVMLFSSLGGSTLVLMGVLAIFYMYEPMADGIENLVMVHRWFLPAALAVPTIIGIIVQNRFIKDSQNWSV